MPKLKIDHSEWVVVCDGTKALVLENVGDDKFPNLKTKEVYEQEAPKTSDQGTDVPGRAINSVGNIRSAMEQTDWHDEAERAFLGKLVDRLAAAAHAGEVKSLIMVAPPRALGVIRPRYTPALKAAVKAELDKDYVKLTVYEIEQHLTAG